MGLTEAFYDKSPFELSGGQKRRVAIAGVLAMNPKVLVLDEPTAGLDPKGRDEILDQIALLHQTRGITIILVSHSMEDIARYVERIIVMNQGEKAFDGTCKEVFRTIKSWKRSALPLRRLLISCMRWKKRISRGHIRDYRRRGPRVHTQGTWKGYIIMIRDITIGQYYPADSILHRLDPRVKFIATIIFIASLFVSNTWTGYLAATVFLAAVIKISKVPFRFMIKGLKAIVVLLMITLFFNMIFTPGEAIFHVWIITITKEGVVLAARMGIRLIYLIIGSSVMTLTTTPNQLTDGLERLLKPLEKIRVPVHDIAMMMSIALRFIPILLEETDKIMKAQIARGADFENGGLLKRLKAWCRCWCRCLSLHFGGRMTWRLRWKPAATTEEREGPR